MRAAILLALLLIAAPAQAQVVPVDTTGIYSDRQLRQRITFQLSQLRNIIAAAEAAQAHAAVTYDHVHRRIVRDSLRAVAPIPADSLVNYMEDAPYVAVPSMTMEVGDTRRICAIAWAGGKPRMPLEQVTWESSGPLVVESVGWNCAEVTALAVTTLNVGSPREYRQAMNSIRRRSRG
jgi:hypothetical protein